MFAKRKVTQSECISRAFFLANQMCVFLRKEKKSEEQSWFEGISRL